MKTNSPCSQLSFITQFKIVGELWPKRGVTHLYDLSIIILGKNANINFIGPVNTAVKENR